MVTKTIPKDKRVQLVSQDLLEDAALTIRNSETGADASVYGAKDAEGAGFPLRSDDEWAIRSSEEYEFGESRSTDGIWVETDTSNTTTIQVIKGVAVERNVRRKQSVDIDADTSGLLKENDQPLDVSDATVPVEQQTPNALEDALGNRINPAEEVNGQTTTSSTSSTGSGNAAKIQVPNGRPTVSIMWDVSGSATVTVEVSTDDTNWYDVTADWIDGNVVTQPSGAETKGTSARAGAEYVRVHVDSNLNTAEISAKGA